MNVIPELRISRRSYYLRFLAWAWNVEPEKLNNICKLFWKTIFLPIGICISDNLYKGIPGITYVYSIVAIFFLAFGLYGPALFVLSLSIIAIPLQRHKIRKKIAKNEIVEVENKEIKEEEEFKLFEDKFDAFIDRHPIFEWILLNLLVRPIIALYDFFSSLPEKRAVTIIKVPFEFLRGVKMKICPRINLVD
jgi:hypothetical protein